MEGGEVMQSFCTAARDIEEDLRHLKNAVDEVREQQQNMLMDTTFPDASCLSQYESLGEKVGDNAARISGALVALWKMYLPKVKDFPQHSDFEGPVSQKLMSLVSELNTSTSQFFNVQHQFVDALVSRLRRQLTSGDDGDRENSEQIAILEDSCNVFPDTDGPCHVNDVEMALVSMGKHRKEISDVEKNVSDVKELFKDMKLLLTPAQGETLYAIEEEIENAVVEVERDKKHREEVETHRKQARSKKLCICGAILMILCVIGITLFVSLTFASG